jgi:hypothetical protein
MDPGSHLADQDITGFYFFTAVSFHAAALGIAVATVF